MYAPLLALLAFQGATQDATAPVFHSELTLVQVDVEVSARDGIVQGLRQEDFQVSDNGKRQEVVYFGHTEQPLDVLLLLDTSMSMAPIMVRLTKTAGDAIGVLRAGDRIAVMAFDRSTELIVDFTLDRNAVQSGLQKVLIRRNEPDSQIQRSVDQAALHFLRQPRSNRRRAVVIVTDDKGTRGWPRTLRDLWEADAVLFGLVIEDQLSAPLFAGGPRDGIIELVDKTGGDILRTLDVGGGFQHLMERLRLRYTLQYAMPEGKPGQQRRIKVELTEAAKRRHSGAKIRARSGYVVR